MNTSQPAPSSAGREGSPSSLDLPAKQSPNSEQGESGPPAARDSLISLSPKTSPLELIQSIRDKEEASAAEKGSASSSWWPCIGWGDSPVWMVNPTTGRAYARHCGRYDCVDCSRTKRDAARLVIERGVRGYLDNGNRVRFLTLTRSAERGLNTVSELLNAWESFQSRLRYRKKAGPYWVTVEQTRRGELHLHALLVDPTPGKGTGYLDNVLSREYTGRKRPKIGDIPPCIGTSGQLVKVSELGVMAWESGFGYVADISEVKSHDRVLQLLADYLCKQVEDLTTADLHHTISVLDAEALDLTEPSVRYLSAVKQQMSAAVAAVRYRDKGAIRIRPFRHSNGWLGGNLADVERELRKERAKRPDEPSAGWQCVFENKLRAEAQTDPPQQLVLAAA